MSHRTALSAALPLMSAAFAAALLAGSAHAQLVDITQPNTTLASVLGHQFRVGDKVFTMPQNAFVSDQFNASQVFISALGADSPTGSGFRLSGTFSDVTPGDLDPSGFMLAYSVDIALEFVAQGRTITTGQLRFNGAATGAGSFTRVDETMRAAGDVLIGSGNVQTVAGGTGVAELNFNASPTSHIDVVKNIRFFANGSSDLAEGGFIDQGFGGNFVVIPLPSSAGLAMAGLGVLATRRRRR